MTGQSLTLKHKVLSMVMCLVCTEPGWSQTSSVVATSPAFDVVSIKSHKSDDGNMRTNMMPERFQGTNVGLKLLIQYAWNLNTEEQVSGLPGWASSAHFDIEAKMDPDAAETIKKLPKEQSESAQHLAMQSLLADRFT